ncbi:CHRD domain-containing protein, partial [Mesorhizobium sp. M8A.F.Ca.ET.208.01.1.1]
MRILSVPMLSALAVSTAFLLAAPAMAETMKFKATLDGSQQSPPVTIKGKGTATLTFDTNKKRLT